MEKVTFAYTISEEQEKLKKERVTKLLQNPYVKAWMKTYHQDETYIYNHSGKFMDWCEVKVKCEQCQGLDFCRQPKKGEVMELYYDGLLSNQIALCPFKVKQKQEKIHKKQYREMDMLDDYLLIDIAKLDVNSESKEYKASVEKVIDIIMNENPEKGLYLWGKPGAGKSFLAAGMCNHYAKRKKKVAFVNVPKLIADLKMMFHEAEAMDTKLRGIKNADIVVLDDIGGESVTSWSRDDILLPLLDARMEKKRLTIFTSNYSLDELKQRLSMTSNKISEPMAAERLLERIKALSCEIFIKGETRRK